VRGYVSTAFWCPYEGKIAPETAVEVIRRLDALGVDEISVGDTIGKAVPEEVHRLLDLLLPHLPAPRIALHFHDTYGHAVENVLTSYARGITIFDASTGGIGGCPYAPGATGNVSMERVIEALRGAGEAIEVDGAALAEARSVIAPSLQRPLDT
jgi:hydroxymethylglutaryl-CoA lyase